MFTVKFLQLFCVFEICHEMLVDSGWEAVTAAVTRKSSLKFAVG